MKKFLLFLLAFWGIQALGQNIVFADPEFKNYLLTNTAVDANTDGEISVSETAQLGTVVITDAPQITSLGGLEQFQGLTSLEISGTGVSAFDFSLLTTLESLTIRNNQFTSIDVSLHYSLWTITIENEPLLNHLDTSGSMINDVFLRSLPHLENFNSINAALSSILIEDSNIQHMNFNGSVGLLELEFVNNIFDTISFQNNPTLTYMRFLGNTVSSLSLSGNTPDLYFSQNSFESLVINNCSHVMISQFTDNQTSLFSVVNSPDVIANDYMSGNTIDHLIFNDCDIYHLLMENNNLNQVDFSGSSFGSAQSNLLNNGISSLDMSGVTANTIQITDHTLTSLSIEESSFEFLGITSSSLHEFNTSNSSAVNLVLSLDGMNSLDLSEMNSIETLRVLNCSIAEIIGTDVQLSLVELDNLPLLQTVFLNNELEEVLTLTNLPSLRFICQDEEFIDSTLLGLASSGIVAEVNTYCSYTPSGDYNTITGTLRFDLNNNGCQISDPIMPLVRINISGDADQATFTNLSGIYNFYTDAGTYTVTPNFENQSLFNVSPTSATATFADDLNNSETFDFCVTPNGNSTDVEVLFSPTEDAVPGFDATYNLVIRNKGNTAVSGNFDLDFDDAVLDFISSDVVPDAQSTGNLSWNYANLLPFETRVVSVTFNLNTPMETPALNDGDVLHFSASVVAAGDINPSDNDFDFNHIVVNSFDPNDITCLEGDIVNPNQIGEYLHYNVRFENLGTAPARNVVVVLEIEETQYNLPSLQLIDASANSYTRVRGNKVEFIFENIMLNPAAGNPPVGGHGNVLFKMKTDAALQTGNSVLNRANIYFDYNFPIETNDAETVFQELSNGDFIKDESIVAYPNPSDGIVEVKASAAIKTLHLFDVQGRLLQTVIGNTTSEKIDISDRSSGIYFLKVTSEKGVNVIKIRRR